MHSEIFFLYFYIQKKRHEDMQEFKQSTGLLASVYKHLV